MMLYFTVSSFLSRFVNLWVHSFFATTAEGESVAQRRGRPVISTNANTLQAVISAWLLDDSISYLVIWDRCNGVSYPFDRFRVRCSGYLSRMRGDTERAGGINSGPFQYAPILLYCRWAESFLSLCQASWFPPPAVVYVSYGCTIWWL